MEKDACQAGDIATKDKKGNQEQISHHAASLPSLLMLEQSHKTYLGIELRLRDGSILRLGGDDMEIRVDHNTR